jgi:iron complex transport system ATP-binding protein
MGMKAVEIIGLSFHRTRQAPPTLDGIDFDLAEGETICIIGPNGAGKSTLVMCVLGLLRHSGGRVAIAGDDIGGLSRAEMARRAAYVPQGAQSTFAFSVRDIALMGRTAHFGSMSAPSSRDRRIADEALERTGIAHLRERKFAELSGGERQLVLIARALAQDTPLIVMDEPTAGLDLGNQRRVLAMIRELGQACKSVLMTTHAPDQALNLNCTVGLLRAGSLIASGPAAEICDQWTMEALYGAPLTRLTNTERAGLAAYVPLL